MKAAVFKKLLAPLEIETVPDPTPGENEVVVEVCRCGICGSDLHITEDPIFGAQPGWVLGHEYSGRIAAIEARLTALLEALGTMRAPLERFYGSLTDEQKAQFERIGSRAARR